MVVELALPTDWLTAGDVLPEKFGSPPYTAVMEFGPAGRPVVVKLALPPVSVSVPMGVAPFMNQIVSPFGGVLPTAETDAVRVTGSPKIDPVGEAMSEMCVAD